MASCRGRPAGGGLLPLGAATTGALPLGALPLGWQQQAVMANVRASPLRRRR
jgi:hypothetical protein